MSVKSFSVPIETQYIWSNYFSGRNSHGFWSISERDEWPSTLRLRIRLPWSANDEEIQRSVKENYSSVVASSLSVDQTHPDDIVRPMFPLADSFERLREQFNGMCSQWRS